MAADRAVKTGINSDRLKRGIFLVIRKSDHFFYQTFNNLITSRSFYNLTGPEKRQANFELYLWINPIPFPVCSETRDAWQCIAWTGTGETWDLVA